MQGCTSQTVLSSERSKRRLDVFYVWQRPARCLGTCSFLVDSQGHRVPCHTPYGWCLASGIREGGVGSWFKIPSDILHCLSLLVNVLFIKDPVEDSQEGLEDGSTIREKELWSLSHSLKFHLLLGMPEINSLRFWSFVTTASITSLTDTTGVLYYWLPHPGGELPGSQNLWAHFLQRQTFSIHSTVLARY